MSDQFIGEIRAFSFGRITTGWVACNGQGLPISQNEALYTLIGTTYGGDGVQTFNVPDLRGRVPLSFGQGPNQPAYVLGQQAGEENHTLLSQEMAQHSHSLTSSTVAATTPTPALNVHLATANPSTKPLYATPANIQNYEVMAPTSVAITGGNGPHNNMMPSLVMSYCIATTGIFPTPQ